MTSLRSVAILGYCTLTLQLCIPWDYAELQSFFCRSFLVLWLAAIPFVFVASLQWMTIGFCVIVGYALLGFESIGVEIESPFGRDYNDLPMDQIGDGIKTNLLGALQYLHTTDESGAVTSRARLLQMRSKRSSVKTDVWGVPERPLEADLVNGEESDP